MSSPNCKQNNSQTAGIGCFGVIVIGLMIFFVGRWSHAPIVEDLSGLSEQVSSLESRVEELQSDLNEMRLEVRAEMAADRR